MVISQNLKKEKEKKVTHIFTRINCIRFLAPPDSEPCYYINLSTLHSVQRGSFKPVDRWQLIHFFFCLVRMFQTLFSYCWCFFFLLFLFFVFDAVVSSLAGCSKCCMGIVKYFSLMQTLMNTTLLVSVTLTHLQGPWTKYDESCNFYFLIQQVIVM